MLRVFAFPLHVPSIELGMAFAFRVCWVLEQARIVGKTIDMRSQLQYSIWASLISMMAVAFFIVLFQFRFESAHAGKHHWISDTDSASIDDVFRELGRQRRMDFSANTLGELLKQLNVFVALESDTMVTDESFREVFDRIDLTTSMDEVMLILAKELDLGLCVEYGRLSVVEWDSDRNHMLRVYDLPEVSSRQLERDILEMIEPNVWHRNGGTASLTLQRNDLGTRCKLLVNAPWRTHRKIERFIAVLADDFGWKGSRVPTWYSERQSELPALPTGRARNNSMVGGMAAMGGSGMGGSSMGGSGGIGKVGK